MLIIAPSARISRLADLEDSVRGSRIVIGENAVIDSFVKIKPAGGSADLVIGDDTIINSGVVLYTGNGVHIGKHVRVSANCTFAPTNHGYEAKDRLIRDQGFLPSRGGIIVEDDVWIGANTVLLDGAVLGRGCVIGAGSLVRGRVEPYAIGYGNPLKITGYRK
jgi:acetyltransferase-like isoleucine patch superfamily enzyme